MNRQTYLAKNDEVARDWYVVDAADQVLGRLSARLAEVLMGKHKATYTPHHDVGDFIVVINADKLKLTGSKPDIKFFQTYSRHTGGQKNFSYRWMLANKPELLLTRAVRRMMPKNTLTHQRMTKLKIYKGAQHPHTAQQPKPLAV